MELAELLSRKRLLIFDFDGTIADSSPLHSRAFNDAFAGHAVAVDYGTIAGLTTEAAVDRVVADLGLSLTEAERSALISDKRSRARTLIEAELEPLEGSVQFIKSARDRFELALCSSASRRNLEASLARLGVAGCFDSIVSAEDVVRGKPAPDGFLRVLEHHGTLARDAVVFEDADAGIAAARAAGIDAVRIVPVGGLAGGTTWTELNAAMDEVRR